MANSTEWLVIIPDLEGSEQKRPHLGKQHVSEMESDRGSVWLLGGMMLAQQPSEGVVRKVTGNMILAKAASEEELLILLKKDVYAQQGVWDLQNAKVYPFESLFRKGLNMP